MKCISRKSCIIISILLLVSCALNACASSLPYSYDSAQDNNAFSINTGNSQEAMCKTFASDICVSDNNFEDISLAIDTSVAGGLFDATNAETVYAKNIHNRMNPASLTKVMTAYIALKYGHLEDTLTASPNVLIKEKGAQLLGIKEGDKMTLEEALHALLLYSANDAAVMIAEYLSGSVESFALVMNDEAKKLGATNTNFKNPHGLTDEEHYTTVYDLYLIFNAAMQNDEFRKIINTKEYKNTYKDRDGNDKNIEIKTTNAYLNEDRKAPDGVSVIGGKTGTTNAAGSCLILLSNSSSGHTYISVILDSDDHDTLYNDMTTLLGGEQ